MFLAFDMSAFIIMNRWFLTDKPCIGDWSLSLSENAFIMLGLHSCTSDMLIYHALNTRELILFLFLTKHSATQPLSDSLVVSKDNISQTEKNQS